MSRQSSKGREWDLIRLAVLERDNYVCAYGCGREATEVDHVVPKADGGTDDEHNLVAACKPCNVRKGTSRLVPINYCNTKWLEHL